MPMPVFFPSARLHLLGVVALAVVLECLALPLGGASPVLAAENGISWNKAGSEAFHDLPGVKPQSPDPLSDGYTCETATASPSLAGRSRSLRDSLPYTVYRCEKDGVIYQGTQPPMRGRLWYPGVNPRNID